MSVNNRLIPVNLSPIISKSSEIFNRVAMTYTGSVTVEISHSTAAEFHELFDTCSCLRNIDYNDIEDDAIRLQSVMLHKPKASADNPSAWKSRLCACGNRVPDELRGETYAGTADTRNTALICAAFSANAVKNGTLDTLRYANFDYLALFVRILYLGVPLVAKRLL
jgi:hypothetical protein